MAKKTVGVILSGSGYLDGSEIQEAVLCLLALDREGAVVRMFAPEGRVAEIDHLKGEPTGQDRSLRAEAARIGRGKVDDLARAKGTDVDAWVLPGGYGAAKNLSDFASKGSSAQAHKEVARVVREAFSAQIPVGACCIAPAVLAAVAKTANVKLRLTIGDDADTAKALQAMGAIHVAAPVDGLVVDEEHKVATTPAYMYGDAPLAKVNDGIAKMIAQVVAWA
jgi:enhancing lycopene biosynthesis protein 2